MLSRRSSSSRAAACARCAAFTSFMLVTPSEKSALTVRAAPAMPEAPVWSSGLGSIASGDWLFCPGPASTRSLGGMSRVGSSSGSVPVPSPSSGVGAPFVRSPPFGPATPLISSLRLMSRTPYAWTSCSSSMEPPCWGSSVLPAWGLAALSAWRPVASSAWRPEALSARRPAASVAWRPASLSARRPATSSTWRSTVPTGRSIIDGSRSPFFSSHVTVSCCVFSSSLTALLSHAGIAR